VQAQQVLAHRFHELHSLVCVNGLVHNVRVCSVNAVVAPLTHRLAAVGHAAQRGASCILLAGAVQRILGLQGSRHSQHMRLLI
jgi:hypothetical protein